ncbi:cupin [Erysipelotrichaceae bacterium]|nr:cupin [Erysipelotrichaceae bacterium]
MFKQASWIEKLQLSKHIEGGYYTQSYISDSEYKTLDGEKRAIASSIYFLLEDTDFSAFHRLKSDEIWNFHYGAVFTIAAIDLEGELHFFELGVDLEKGQYPQVVIPKGWIFGSYTTSGFGVCGCVVAPGFEYEDFELFTQKTLLLEYPKHEEIIKRLTRK